MTSYNKTVSNKTLYLSIIKYFTHSRWSLQISPSPIINTIKYLATKHKKEETIDISTLWPIITIDQ
jgi:hypothetical protein